MKCPYCHEEGAKPDGTDNLGNQWYECQECGEQFSELDAD
jgi:transposase-like protein